MRTSQVLVRPNMLNMHKYIRVEKKHEGESRDTLNVCLGRTYKKLIIISLILSEFPCVEVQIPCRFCSKSQYESFSSTVYFST